MKRRQVQIKQKKNNENKNGMKINKRRVAVEQLG